MTTEIRKQLDREALRNDTLNQLRKGPVKSFGSSRERDYVLQALKREGVIKYTPKNRGGKGWELVHKSRL